MTEDKKECEGGVCKPGHHPSMCASTCCSGMGHVLLRLALGLVILAVVFSMGIKLGELKATLGNDGGYGYGGNKMMRNERFYRMMPTQGEFAPGINTWGPQMMRGGGNWTGPNVPQPTATSTPR